MSSIQQAYELLGIPHGSEEDAVKEVYRQLAKKYHPDRNPAPDAHDRFVAVHEAYEAILRHLKNQAAPAFERLTNAATAASAREQATRRAQEFARKSYEAYQRSEQYQEDQDYISVAAFMGMLLLVFVFVFLPLIFRAFIGDYSFIGVYIALILITLPITWPMMRDIRKIQFTRLLPGFGAFVRQSIIAQFLFMLVNFFWLMGHATKVIIPPALICLAFVMCATAIGLFRKKRGLSYGRPGFIAVGIAAFAFNLLLLINSAGSYSQWVETYYYEYKGESVRHTHHGKTYQTYKEDALITLEGNAYRYYPGMRYFMNRDKMSGSYVHYTMSRGLLGIQVMEEYHFSSGADPVH